MKQKGMIVLNKKRWVLLLAVLLTGGCSEVHRKIQFPQRGVYVNKRFKIGDKLPTFTAIDSEGDPYLVDGSKTSDRYTMIFFWQSDPNFCQFKVPRFVKLYEEYEGLGFQVVSINVDEPLKAGQSVANLPSFPWTSLYDNPENSLVDELALGALPSIFLLNDEGTIISSHSYLNCSDLEFDVLTGEATTVFSIDRVIKELFINGE